MTQIKPNVFPSNGNNRKPSQAEIDAANETADMIKNQLLKEQGNDGTGYQVPDAERAAAEEMRRKTLAQLEERNKAIAKQNELTAKYAEESDKILKNAANPPVPPSTPVPPTNYDDYLNQPPSNDGGNVYDRIDSPQEGVPYDLIPLPSEGKLYPNKKKSIRVSYLTAADENILTNPNLFESGNFIEILFNRKMMDTDIRYKDLHVGDRNAIMIWLRATGYGSEYPVTLTDPTTGEPFDTEIDLNDLKYKPLGAEPDAEGYFDYILPISNTPIKFKLLTVRDVDDIESHVDQIQKEKGQLYADAITYTLKKHIVEVKGSRHPEEIAQFVDRMRAGDSRALRKYIDEIESGVDLRVTVRTPGGGSFKTFLPLNITFFWPDLRI